MKYMKKSEVKKLFLSRGEVAKDFRETYFLTTDGTPINLGSRINCCGEIERTVEHSSIFIEFGLKYFQWKIFFNKTGAVGICPENKTAFCNNNQKLTKRQLQFIKNNNLTLIGNKERF